MKIHGEVTSVFSKNSVLVINSMFYDLNCYLLPYKHILSSLVIKVLQNNVLKPAVTSMIVDKLLCPAAKQFSASKLIYVSQF